MILPSSLFFWLLQCSLLLLGNAEDAHHIRGVPGKDYPNYETIPQTSFRCSEQPHIPGFYADPETGCQMFHHCYEHRHESFLCPPGTIFNQAILSCDYWYSADCNTATLHYRANSPQKVISFDPEIEFVPMKNPSVNVFDKMASLYEVKGQVPMDSKYESNDYTSEENNYFRKGDSLSKNIRMIENQKYADSYLEVSNHHDRREGVLVESPDEHGYFQGNENNENGFRMFEDSEDSDESSGETEDIDDHVFTEDNLSSRNDQEVNVDFEKQYFTYNEDSHLEYAEKHSGNVGNGDEAIDSYTEFSDGQASSSKEDLESGGIFIRRQSGNIENRNDRRNKRRKPIFTIIEPTAEIEHFSSTKNYEDKIKIQSNDTVGYPSYTSKESEAGSKTLSTQTPSRTKRRKPILIDLEDSLQYNVDNGENVAGDKRTSISYEVNSESKFPEFSIDAEKISMKLLPNKIGRKRKPYLLDTLEQYNVESERNIDLSSLNLASPASNIYDASTLSTMENIKKYEDVSMNFHQVYPKRKKNVIHIIDEDNYHNVYTDNEESMYATTYASTFEDEITTQTFNFKDFEKISEPNYYDVEKEHEIEGDSLELGTEQYEDQYNFISPHTHYEISDGSDDTYFAQINPEVTIKVKEYEDESAVEDKAISVNSKRLEDFEIDTHNEIQDSSYVTTEFSISDISTEMPTEIQYAEDTSRFYFIPNSIVQSLDNLGTPESIPYLVPETLDENHDIRDSLARGDFELNPSYQTSTESISYEPLEDSMVRDAVIEHAHSEDDFQTLIKLLPDNTYESHKEIKHPQNSEFEESKLNYEDEILSTNISENITNAEYAHSREEVEEFDPILDTELQEYLSNENSNIEDNFNVDLTKNIHSEPAVSFLEDSSSKHILGRQYHSLDPIFDVDTMEAQDSIQNEVESIYQTVATEIESEHYEHLSNDPIKTDILERIEKESIENKGAKEFDETSDIEVSSNDFKGGRTDSLNESVSHPATTSDFASFETQNIPSYLQDNSFNPKVVFKNKDTVEDASKSNTGNTVSSSEANALNKEYSILERNNPGSIKTDTKDEPVRRPRAFTSPYQMDFNLQPFDSQNFASLPYSMLKLKQSGMAKFLPYSMYRHGSESMAYSTRTGNLLQSPKISKLISIGKKLLRAKKAKFRILSKYVNSFQTDQ